eukprot:Sspe_Gene.16008::Locus_5617_Transcript_1_1_Confidence_1.000_Length_834::g.16008::m.16008/K17805/PAM16, TIM16; mitochondrial import inner membrane translocase subunit TIM16
MSPLLQTILKVGGALGGIALKAAYDAYRVQAAQNLHAGTVATAQRVQREMTKEEALQILNIRNSNFTAPLTTSERELAEKNFKEYFEANAPPPEGPGGSAYIQGKVITAYKHLVELEKNAK